MKWGTGRLLREAWANLVAERARGFVLVVMIAVLSAIPVYLEGRDAGVAIANSARLDAAGRQVLVARSFTEQAEDSRGISVQRCHGLEHNQAVKNVGGIAHSERVRYLRAPGEVATIQYVTGNLLWIFDPDLSHADRDMYISPIVADRLGIVDGATETVSISSEAYSRIHQRTMGVVNLLERVPDPGPFIWTWQAPDGHLSECWVEFQDTVDPAVATELLSSWFANDNAQVLVQPLLGSDRLRSDPLYGFTANPNRWSWTLAGAAIGLMILLVMWFRRADFALYRSVGRSSTETMILLALPYVLLLTMGAVIGLLTGFAVHIATAGLFHSLVPRGILQIVLTTSVAIVITMTSSALLSKRNIARDIRDST